MEILISPKHSAAFVLGQICFCCLPKLLITVAKINKCRLWLWVLLTLHILAKSEIVLNSWAIEFLLSAWTCNRLIANKRKAQIAKITLQRFGSFKCCWQFWFAMNHLKMPKFCPKTSHWDSPRAFADELYLYCWKFLVNKRYSPRHCLCLFHFRIYCLGVAGKDRSGEVFISPQDQYWYRDRQVVPRTDYASVTSSHSQSR